MVAKGPKIANRQPNVLLIFEDVNEFAGVTSIIKTQFSEYRAIRHNKQTVDILTEAQPPVILFGLATVEKSIEFYSTLVEKGKLNYAHYSIVLCSNKQSLVAFSCCMKGVFDNYFVFQPLTEKFRLLMIVQAGLLACESKSNLKEFNEDLFNSIDEELSQQIDEASYYKQNLLSTIQQGRESINKISEDLQQQSTDKGTSPQKIVSILTDDHVNPLLSSLEEGICFSLEQIISQLVAKQISQQTNQLYANRVLQDYPSEQEHAEEVNSVKRELAKTSAGNLDEGNQQDITTTDPTIDQTSEQEFTTEKTVPAPILRKSNKKHILVAEDNPLYKDMLLSILISEGYNVDAAEDGIVALQKIKEHTYDLILMDLFMPKLDGLNVTKKIREISGGKDIPVIALTGNKNKELVRKWASYGLKGYIIKPSSRDDIISSVRKVFGTETADN
ncbi:MAG: CheY-like chemotaxis protein [Alteromonadaceae bacterium]|jgi:CheY-like chemotaxis protein